MPFLSFAIDGRRAFVCLIEAALIAAMFWGAHRVLGYSMWSETSFDGVLHQSLIPAALIFASIVACGGYQPDVQSEPSEMAQRVALGAVCGGILVLAVSLVFFQHDRPAAPLVAGIALSVASLIALRLTFTRIRFDIFENRVAVLGAGERAARLVSALPEGARDRIVGYIANSADRTMAAPSGALIASKEGEGLAARLRRQHVRELIVALDDRRSGSFPTKELIDCRMRGIAVTDVNSYIERETGKVDLDDLYPSWLIFSPGFRTGVARDVIKRASDIFFSLLLLVLFMPVLIVTALLVKLESPGPVFYLQTRVGKDGKPFKLYKFRSMRSDAEKDGAVWARKNDDRVTRVGRIIRKIRIDEIPQAINVLRGEMSFVGPRPERPEFVEMLSKEIDLYEERHRVKPGITGWAQVRYPYGASVEDAREKLKYDLFYMKNYSAVFDISIILQTVRVMLFALGGR